MTNEICKTCGNVHVPIGSVTFDIFGKSFIVFSESCLLQLTPTIKIHKNCHPTGWAWIEPL